MKLTGAAALFQPTAIGRLTIRNRVVCAPCTRQRCRLDGTPTDLVARYYRQRASAGFIVTEGIAPGPFGVGYLFSPGLFTDAHVQGWRAVTEAVHAEGGVIFAQIMHAGRISDPLLLPQGELPVAPSAVRPDPNARCYGAPARRAQRSYGEPRALSEAEVEQVITEFGNCTGRAMKAGFDGVEIHAGTGYLPMQFLCPNTNLRNDRFGGDVAGRSRFLLACVEAAAAVRGAGRVAVRITPGFRFNDVHDPDPGGTYSFVVPELSRRGIAYLHVGAINQQWDVHRRLRPLFEGPYMAVGGYSRAAAIRAVRDEGITLIGFGRDYIANPDLAAKLRHDWPLNRPDPTTFYTQGAKGYVDYPTYRDGPV